MSKTNATMAVMNPVDFLATVGAYSEESALVVAIAMYGDKKSSPTMLHAAWSAAKNRNTTLSCRQCSQAMVDYDRHEPCRRQTSSDEFIAWTDEDRSEADRNDEFNDLVEDSIISEVTDHQ